MFTFGTPNLGTRRFEEFFIQVEAGLAVSTSDNHGKPSLVCALFISLARFKVTGDRWFILIQVGNIIRDTTFGTGRT